MFIVFTYEDSVVFNSKGSNISSVNSEAVKIKWADASQSQVSASQVLDISYFSGENEDFYDAEE